MINQIRTENESKPEMSVLQQGQVEFYNNKNK